MNSEALLYFVSEYPTNDIDNPSVLDDELHFDN